MPQAQPYRSIIPVHTLNPLGYSLYCCSRKAAASVNTYEALRARVRQGVTVVFSTTRRRQEDEIRKNTRIDDRGHDETSKDESLFPFVR